MNTSIFCIIAVFNEESTNHGIKKAYQCTQGY